LNKVVNTYLANNRFGSQRAATTTARAATVNTRKWSRAVIGTRAEVRRRGGIIPSWTILAMVLLAMAALCATVTMRFHLKANAATKQHEEINKEIDLLRNNNRALQSEVQRLQSDPRTIESAARKRLNMVRENEIILPVE
jgi:cell division protein FtsL